jgi:hypothetical protein
MQGGTGRFLRLAGLWIKPRCLTVRPILLHFASSNVCKSRVTKERQQMDADYIGLRRHIPGIAFAQRDNLELTGERFCGVLETGAGWRSPTPPIGRRAGSGDKILDGNVQQGSATASALAIFDASLHVPIAGKILRGGKARLLGRLPMVATSQIGGALPVAATLTPINVERTIH